jgi:TDG/mug DNA glycosylase family protein
LEDRHLPAAGLGITNLVARSTARAAELSAGELRAGGRRIEQRCAELTPRFVAFAGIGAYRVAFGRRGAGLGLQPERLGGSAVWVLPNPSGLNAGYQLPALAAAFRALREAAWPS